MAPDWINRQSEENARYEFLMRLYQVIGDNPHTVVHAGEIGFRVGLTRVQTFAVVEYLADQGYVDYLGAGPRIRLAPRGLRYIQLDAGTRRTIR